MAADYKYTEAEYTALKQALATGALIVRYEDKQVEYRSAEQMAALLSQMERELKSEAGTTVLRHARFNTSKGL